MLEQVGELSYNGISFAATSKVRATINAVKDPSDRIVIYHECKFTIETVLSTKLKGSDDLPTGLEITPQQMRYRLQEQGKRFILKDKGFGYDIDLGGRTGGVQDVNYGPKPEILSWEPVGNNLAFGIVWEVTVRMTPDDSPGIFRGILSFSYDAQYDIDERGFTARTITGSLQCTVNLNANGTLNNSAEKYRNQIFVEPPLGYQRRKSFHYSTDKSVLDFMIQDTQIPSPNVYPPYVTKLVAKHRAARNRSRIGKVMSVISVSIELAANVPSRDYSWFIATGIALARMTHTRSTGVQVILSQVEVEEDIYGLNDSFSFQYHTLDALSDIIQVTGMFQPITNWIDWNAFRAAMIAVVEQGQSALGGHTFNDRIPNIKNQNLPYIRDNQLSPIQNFGTNRYSLCNPAPDPDKSWWSFEGEISLGQDGNPIAQVPLQVPFKERGVVDINTIPTAPNIIGAHPAQTIYIDYGAQVVTELRFTGKAIRIGHQIPEPKLEGITTGTGYFALKSKKFDQKQVGTWYCQPVFAAKWDMVYIMDNTVGGGSAVLNSGPQPTVQSPPP